MNFNDKEKNRKIIKDYIEKIINTGETSTISEYIDSNYTEIFEGKRFEVGIEGAKEHIEGVRNTYPDLILFIDQQICEGEWVVTTYTMSGTQRGEWIGTKPTNKKITVTGVNIDRIVNGKIIEHVGAVNLLEPLLKINAISIVNK